MKRNAKMNKRKSPEDDYIADMRAGKRLYGQSHPSASGALGKKPGGAGGSFDGKTKQWYSTSEKVWLAMYRTGMWRPWTAKADISLICEKLRERDEAVKKAIEEASSKKKPSETQVEQHLRRELRIPDDDPLKLATLEREHGVSADVVDRSGRCARLGPRSGISNADRVLRGLRLNVITAPELVELLGEKE